MPAEFEVWHFVPASGTQRSAQEYLSSNVSNLLMQCFFFAWLGSLTHGSCMNAVIASFKTCESLTSLSRLHATYGLYLY